MLRKVEITCALLLVLIAGLCLWYFRPITAGIMASIAIAIATGLYIHSSAD